MMGSLSMIESPAMEKNVFVLRFPLLNNSIRMGTKILVKPNQVAVFVENGEIFDVLEQGIHILGVNNLPKLAEKKHWDRHFNSAFHCEIYFVSLTLFENIKWAMVNSLIIRDNDFGSIAIKCYGNFAFKVVDAALFMKELFGRITTFNDEDISLYVRTLIVTGVTEMLTTKRIAALDFVANYDKLEIRDFSLVSQKFENSGLLLQQLNIEHIAIPEEVEKLLNYKVQEKAGETHSNGLPVNHPINAGTVYSSEMRKMFNFTHDLTITCVECGATIAKNFNYCPQCGAENKETAKECPKCHNIVAFKANFCPDCGTKLFDKNKVVLCKHCGKIVSENDLYCPDCGRNL